MTWGLMLDNGFVIDRHRHKTREEAREHLRRLNAKRRDDIARGELVTFRRVIAIIKEKPRPAATLGAAGGKARAKKLPSSRRSEIARKAAKARWAKGE